MLIVNYEYLEQLKWKLVIPNSNGSGKIIESKSLAIFD